SGVRPAARPDEGAPMRLGYHPLVKQLLDGELSLDELPPELRPEAAEAVRLVGAVDRTPVVLSPALDERVMAVVRRHAASRTRRALHWLTTPRDVELRLRLRPAVWAGALALAAGVAVRLLERAPSSTLVPSWLTRSGARESATLFYDVYASVA